MWDSVIIIINNCITHTIHFFTLNQCLECAVTFKMATTSSFVMERHLLTDFHVPSVVAMMGTRQLVVRTPDLGVEYSIPVPAQGVAHTVLLKLNTAPEERYAEV